MFFYKKSTSICEGCRLSMCLELEINKCKMCTLEKNQNTEELLIILDSDSSVALVINDLIVHDVMSHKTSV